MAMSRQRWIRWFTFQALYFSACVGTLAQTSPPAPTPIHLVHIQAPRTGSLAGRLTDLHSIPLEGITVVLSNQVTGASVHAVTAKNGVFHISALDAGEYTLDADRAQLGHGRLEGIRVNGGTEARIQAALRFENIAPTFSVEISAPNRTITTASPTPIGDLNSAHPAEAFVGSVLSLPTVSSPRPTTSRPPLTESIAALPLRTLSVQALNESGATNSLKQLDSSPQLPQRIELQRAPTTGAAAEQAKLETRSTALQPILATTQLRTLPLSGAFSPALAVGTAMACGVQAIIRSAQLHLTPVMAAAQVANPVDGAVATTLTAAQEQALPISGRRWEEFLLNAPGTASPAASSQASVRGTGQESASVTIDGANTTLAFGVTAESGAETSDLAGQGANQQDSAGQSPMGGRGSSVSEAAIREVRTTASNVDAEGMYSADGRTSIRTQSGGDSFHGQGFLFDRQNTWGARNPFTQWVQNTGSDAAPNFTAAPYTPPDHEMVWGLGMGSRIRRDKLFWFAALDSYRRNDPGVATVKNSAKFFNLPEPTSANILLLSAQLGESQLQAYNDYLGIETPGHAAAGLEQLAELLRTCASVGNTVGQLWPH